MKLSQGNKEQTYTIKELGVPKQTQDRLQSLGMTQDTSIEIVQKKHNGT